MVKTAAYTSIGSKKKTNQDGYCILTADADFGEVVFLAVCDGVGGLSMGEVASSAVVSRFVEWFESDLPHYLKYNGQDNAVCLDGLKGVWGQLVEEMNERILRHGSLNRSRLGTTLSCVLFCQGRYFGCHVGDCRIYLSRDGMLSTLTHDQTLVAREVQRGNLTLEEAAVHPRRNVLLQAVGTQDNVTPEFIEGAAHPGDVYLICCDGLYRELGDAYIGEQLSIAKKLTERELTAFCQALVNESMGRGETDNITAVCMVYGEASEGSGLVATFGANEETTLLDENSDECTTVLAEQDAHSSEGEDEATTILDESADSESAHVRDFGADDQTTLLEDDSDDCTTILEEDAQAASARSAVR